MSIIGKVLERRADKASPPLPRLADDQGYSAAFANLQTLNQRRKHYADQLSQADKQHPLALEAHRAAALVVGDGFTGPTPNTPTKAAVDVAECWEQIRILDKAIIQQELVLRRITAELSAKVCRGHVAEHHQKLIAGFADCANGLLKTEKEIAELRSTVYAGGYQFTLPDLHLDHRLKYALDELARRADMYLNNA